MLNKVMLIGHLGSDPEVKAFQNGGKIANLRIATGEKWRDRQTGETRERTEWHSVSILSEGLAGVAEKYLRKGSKVYVEGMLRTRKWQDREGKDRWTTEVVLSGPGAVLVMLDGRRDGPPSDHPSTSDRGEGLDRTGRTEGGAGGPAADAYPELDDEVPF